MSEDAEQLPDLDEFDGMSTQDIAASVGLWKDGTEDQQRALAALRRRAPGIGDNRAPLAEALDEELAGMRARQEELLDIVKKSLIVDSESAEKVTNLSAKMRDLEVELDAARKTRVQPYLDGQRLINARFGGIAQPLTLARQGEDGKGGLRRMLTEWEDKKEAEAEAERQRALAEARRREEAAAAARRAAEERAAQGKATAADELEVAAAEEEAERAQQRAEAIRPEPTRAHLGQVTRRREIVFEIDNYRETIGWILRQDGPASQLMDAVTNIIDRYLRGLGVAAVGRGVSIPGCRIGVERGAANIRR